MSLERAEPATEALSDPPPPFLRTWPRVYLGVIGYLLFLITIFSIFTRTFSA